MFKTPTYLHLFLLFIIIVSIYSNSINAFFCGDDFYLLTFPMEYDANNKWSNVFTKSYAPVPFYRPITILSLSIDYKIWHLNPVGYHITNILLHFTCTILVYILVGILTNNTQNLKLISASLFAVHPVHTESVVWIASRSELLFTAFYLLGFIFYITSSSKSPIKYILSRYFIVPLCFALSIFSKESGISFIPMIIVYEFIYQNNKKISWHFLKNTFILILPFLIISSFYLFVRQRILSAEGSIYVDYKLYAGEQFIAIIFLLMFYYLFWINPESKNKILNATITFIVGLFLITLILFLTQNTNINTIHKSLLKIIQSIVVNSGFFFFYLVTPIITYTFRPYITLNEYAPLYFVGVSSIIITIAFLIIIRKQILKSPYLSFTFISIFITLLPTINNISGKRYLYLSSVGYCLFISMCLLSVKDWFVINNKGKDILSTIYVFLYQKLNEVIKVSGVIVILLFIAMVVAKNEMWKKGGEINFKAIKTMMENLPPDCNNGEIYLIVSPFDIDNVVTFTSTVATLGQFVCEKNAGRVIPLLNLYRFNANVNIEVIDKNIFEIIIDNYKENLFPEGSNTIISNKREQKFENDLFYLDSQPVGTDGKGIKIRMTLKKSIYKKPHKYFFYYSDGDIYPLKV